MASQDLINTIIAEAGGEGDAGIIAATWAIAQRAAARGQTMDQVIRSGFDGYSNPGSGARRSQQDPALRRKVENIIQGVSAGTIPNPVPRADHFLSGDVMPSWARNMDFVGQVGGHRFYASGQVPASAIGMPTPPGEIPNVVGTARDVVPPSAPVPVTPSPSMSAMRSAPNLADVPLPRPRPSAPDIVTPTMAMLNNRQMSASDSLALDPVSGQAVPDLNAGRFTGPVPDAGYFTKEPGFNAGSGAKLLRPANMTFGEISYAAQDRGAPIALPQRTAVAPVPAQQSVDMQLMRSPSVQAMLPPAPNPETARLAQIYAGGGPTRPNMNAADRLMPQGNLAPRIPVALPSVPPIMVNPVQVASAGPVPMPAYMRPGSTLPPMPTAMPVAPAIAPRMAPVPMPRMNRQQPAQAPLRVVVNGGNVQRPAPSREEQIAAILARSRGSDRFGGGGTIDGALQPTGTIFKRN